MSWRNLNGKPRRELGHHQTDQVQYSHGREGGDEGSQTVGEIALLGAHARKLRDHPKGRIVGMGDGKGSRSNGDGSEYFQHIRVES